MFLIWEQTFINHPKFRKHMEIKELDNKVHSELFKILEKDIKEFRPAQVKAIEAGLLERKNILVCTPTASGKTLIAEIAAFNGIFNRVGKAIYIVPLKALANEKYKEFKKKYGLLANIAISIGDLDSPETHLNNADVIITTSEKLDSLIRHHTPWLKYVATIIIDEIHLLNDTERGPTLEILITILKQILKAQIIGLSATIGNPQELADWLEAELVVDDWRPVKLKQGVCLNNEIEFIE